MPIILIRMAVAEAAEFLAICSKDSELSRCKHNSVLELRKNGSTASAGEKNKKGGAVRTGRPRYLAPEGN
jgi:hypothetical protein